MSVKELEMIIAHADGQTDYSTGTQIYFCGQSVESYMRSGKVALLTSPEFAEYRVQWRRDLEDGIVESFDDMVEWHFEKHLGVKPPWFDGDLVQKWKAMAAEHFEAGGEFVQLDSTYSKLPSWAVAGSNVTVPDLGDLKLWEVLGAELVTDIETQQVFQSVVCNW